jgi:hypothetical protein
MKWARQIKAKATPSEHSRKVISDWRDSATQSDPTAEGAVVAFVQGATHLAPQKQCASVVQCVYLFERTTRTGPVPKPTHTRRARNFDFPILQVCVADVRIGLGIVDEYRGMFTRPNYGKL